MSKRARIRTQEPKIRLAISINFHYRKEATRESSLFLLVLQLLTDEQLELVRDRERIDLTEHTLVIFHDET